MTNTLEFIFLTFTTGLIILTLLPTDWHKCQKITALSTAFVLLFQSLHMLSQYEALNHTFIHTNEILVVRELKLYFAYGADGMSLYFIALTAFIFVLCFMINMDSIKNLKGFLICLLSIEALSILSFASLDLLFFYVFFESLLIPMFILIGIWGARERKIKAAYYFFLYTFFGSLFMLFAILNIYTICQTTHYDAILSTDFSLRDQIVLWICFFIAFSVKIPSFPFHIWLPEAHVEAPTAGSVILASLLLKLGGYGFLRYALPILPEGCITFNVVVSGIAIISIIFASLATIRQIDLKKIIAYSSVAHMNVVVLGIFSNTQQGIDGAMYLMIAHGVVSGALFFCVGVLYDRYHTRLLKYYAGVTAVMPLFATLFFIFTLANMGFPGTSNFIGEFLIFIGLIEKNVMVMALATTGVVLSAVYSIWLFGRVCFGQLKVLYIDNFTDINKREAFILITLAIAAIALGLSSNGVLEVFDGGDFVINKKGL